MFLRKIAYLFAISIFDCSSLLSLAEKEKNAGSNEALQIRAVVLHQQQLTVLV